MESMFSLSDCGCAAVRVPFTDCATPYTCPCDVVMVIKAPRGQATIFMPGPGVSAPPDYCGQSAAIRAFMEQHRDG